MVELTDGNFRKKVVMEKELGWLVEFYAPWLVLRYRPLPLPVADLPLPVADSSSPVADPFLSPVTDLPQVWPLQDPGPALGGRRHPAQGQDDAGLPGRYGSWEYGAGVRGAGLPYH